LITCAILLWYGATQGASIVAGFALTLMIGVLVSLFTAVTVTRTFLRLMMDMNVTENLWWFGVSNK
jgi:preprotein translocase subunit SecD